MRRLAWSSAWQKYCEAKSSGRQTISAPWRGGVADFLDGAGAVFLGRGPQRICTSATRVGLMAEEVVTVSNAYLWKDGGQNAKRECGRVSRKRRRVVSGERGERRLNSRADLLSCN